MLNEGERCSVFVAACYLVLLPTRDLKKKIERPLSGRVEDHPQLLIQNKSKNFCLCTLVLDFHIHAWSIRFYMILQVSFKSCLRVFYFTVLL